MHKPSRKNSHKERIFSLPQNKIDFTYQKEHQDRTPKEHAAALRTEAPSLLEAHKARESVKNIEGWQLTSDHKMIYREFKLLNFMSAVDMINQIAQIAEDEKHHPDVHLTQYRILRVGLTSHDVGGLSEKDLVIARKINDLPPTNKAVAVNQQLKDKEQAQQKVHNEPKKTQVKQKKDISLTLKKSVNKTKGVKLEKSVNRIKHTVKKT